MSTLPKHGDFRPVRSGRNVEAAQEAGRYGLGASDARVQAVDPHIVRSNIRDLHARQSDPGVSHLPPVVVAPDRHASCA